MKERKKKSVIRCAMVCRIAAEPQVQEAISDLLDCFGGEEIPIQLISQYLPQQRPKVQSGALEPKAEALLLDRIAGCYEEYHAAAGSMEKLGFL